MNPWILGALCFFVGFFAGIFVLSLLYAAQKSPDPFDRLETRPDDADEGTRKSKWIQ